MENPQLDFLERIKDDLENVDPVLVNTAILEMKNKPITIAFVHKDRDVIDSVTIHEKDYRAPNIQRLSYNNNLEILEKQRDNGIYGRANLPGEAMFYGALSTLEISMNRATAFMETTSMTKDMSINEEYFTVSRWLLKQDIKVYECAFQSSKDVNKGVLKSREVQTGFLQNLSNNEEISLDAIRQLKFFSDEFSKYVDRTKSKKYMITSMFSNMIFKHIENEKLEIGGITYPSVQSGLKGQNIALLPSTVDNSLFFEKAVVMKAERKDDGGILIEKSFEIADKWDENGNLIWK